MTQLYSDYVWIGGLPYGICALPNNGNSQFASDSCDDIGYKISQDPYRKRISIEKYRLNQFLNVVYDSYLFDFRHLKQNEQLAWQKEIVKEVNNEVQCYIRNQDDRLILEELYTFERNLCRSCLVRSCHGIEISKQQLSYTFLGDSYNEVTLYDANDHAVLRKQYHADAETGEFTDLIHEEWDMRKQKLEAVKALGVVGGKASQLQ